METVVSKRVIANLETISHKREGEELKALRKRLGLSLSVAARQMEVSVSSLCRWESGKQRIPSGAVKLLKILNGVNDAG